MQTHSCFIAGPSWSDDLPHLHPRLLFFAFQMKCKYSAGCQIDHMASVCAFLGYFFLTVLSLSRHPSCPFTSISSKGWFSKRPWLALSAPNLMFISDPQSWFGAIRATGFGTTQPLDATEPQCCELWIQVPPVNRQMSTDCVCVCVLSILFLQNASLITCIQTSAPTTSQKTVDNQASTGKAALDP